VVVQLADRIRKAASFDAIAYAVIAELTRVGARAAALVLCDASGEPAVWIGDGFDRCVAQTFVDHDHRAELARLRTTYTCIVHDGVHVAPLLGDGVIGMLRVVGEVPELAVIASVISVRLASLGDTRTLNALTPRQREVAELVAHGCTNIEIGNMLAISANAVKKHVSRVLEMLDVSNRTELAALTGRWRTPSGNDQVLPPTVQVVSRNPAKSNAGGYRAQVA
jgi:DNA-binding CsgD family transcriptional regulator